MPATTEVTDSRSLKMSKLDTFLKAEFKEGGYLVRVG